MTPPSESDQLDRAAATPRIVTSGELMAGRSEVVIDHNGVQYRLRITRQDKLILTK